MSRHRALIEAVEARGGPLRLDRRGRLLFVHGRLLAGPSLVEPQAEAVLDPEHGLAEGAREMFAAVLRRDLARRGYRMEHVEFPRGDIEPDPHRVLARRKDAHVLTYDADTLTAHLRVWLAVVEAEEGTTT